MSLPRIIGITGKAGVGKDTLANHLVDGYGYAKMSLADPIKHLLNERFGWGMNYWEDRAWKERTDPVHGWRKGDGMPFSPRSWAQWLGTEVGRAIGGENVWIDMMVRQWNDAGRPLAVVPDVRFPNEAVRIINLGGAIIEIMRPDVAAVASHSSENGVPRGLVDCIVMNDGDREKFCANSIVALETVYAAQYP